MGTATNQEHEFKFLVPDDFEMPGLDDLCRGGDTVVEQTATYYDTTDLRLSRAGRVRCGSATTTAGR